MSEQQTSEQQPVSRVPIYIATGFLAIFSAIFAFEFIDLSGNPGGLRDSEIVPESYMDLVTPLLVDSDPAIGRELMQTYNCNSCHENNLGPTYDVISANAAERRPPMQAAAYIYESILYPGALVVEPYQNNMPRVYEDDVSSEDLGHMIAYLLDAPPADVVTSGGVDAEMTAEVTPALIPTDQLTDEIIREYELQASFLEGGDPENGEELLELYGCNVCHGGNNVGILGPAHSEAAELGAERRPPLSAAAYIYEAIIYPGRYIVDGYEDVMPKDYDDRMTTSDLADVLAYLLQAE